MALKKREFTPESGTVDTYEFVCPWNSASVESAMGSGGGGGVVAEPSKKKPVDLSINHFFVRRQK